MNVFRERRTLFVAIQEACNASRSILIGIKFILILPSLATSPPSSLVLAG